MIILSILCLISFLISFTTVALIKQRFSQLLLDIPNERSSHTQPTPRGGGLGFIIGFAISSAIAVGLTNVITLIFSFPYPDFLLGLTPQQWLYIWLTLTPLAIVGIIDDRQGVPSRIRYLIQITSAGLAVTAFGVFPQPWLTFLGLGGTIIAFVLTLIAFTAFINFYNFMDGLDGLLVGVSLVQMSFLAIYLNQPFLWLLVAALLGFLWWNWSPAKIFMGDAGSTVLGAMIAIALLIPQNSASQAWSTIAITLPLVGDTIYTLTRRLIRKENIFEAHRSHIYQRLQQSGWTHSQVAITYMILTSAIAILISTLGLRGSGLSIILILGAIILSEAYLSPQKITAKLEEKK